MTSHAKTFKTTVEDNQGVIKVIKTQQIGDKQPEVIDVVEQKTTEETVQKFTIIKNDPKTGVPISHTNDLTIIENDRFFPRIRTFLNKEINLETRGYVLQCQTSYELQRSKTVTNTYISEL